MHRSTEGRFNKQNSVCPRKTGRSSSIYGLGTRDFERCALLITLALAPSGCTLELCLNLDSSTESVGAAEDPIVGGQIDASHRATVALLSTQEDGSRSLCSGTVIAKRDGLGYVLTAAHCVSGTVDSVYDATDWYDCTPGGDPDYCNASYQPINVYTHPDYGTGSHASDFAIVVFDGATADTVVVPAAGSQDELFAGSPIQLSGYGRTYAGAEQPGAFNHKRNFVDVSVASLFDDWIRIDGSTGKTACFGDSGGPAYAAADGELHVVGVASNGDATCEHVANYGRVAFVYDSFIAPIIQAPVTPEEGGAGGGGGSAPEGSGGGTAGSGGAGSGGASPEGAGGSCTEDDPDTGGGVASGTAEGGGVIGGASADSTPETTNCKPVTLGCAAAPSSPTGYGALGCLLALAAATRGRWGRRTN